MRIARLVSVVPVDGVDESWKTLPPSQDFRQAWRSAAGWAKSALGHESGEAFAAAVE
jgi:hypothetical protein